MLENNPVLRERLLGVTAVSAILIGGAVGFDTMVTSGWQIGAGEAPAAYAAMTPQQYFDDVSRDWTRTPPQRVRLASANTSAASFTQAGEELDGGSDGVVALISSAPGPTQAAAPHAPGDLAPGDLALAAQSQAADQRFDAIEADIRQATAQVQSNEPTKDAAPATASDTQG